MYEDNRERPLSGNCQGCEGGPAITFSGMFLFEPKTSCIAAHVPQVPPHAYTFRYMQPKSHVCRTMQRNEVWEISAYPEEQRGNISGLLCPKVKGFRMVETSLRYCKITLPHPCCVEPLYPLSGVHVGGPIQGAAQINVVYRFFRFRYSTGTKLTFVSDSGFAQTVSEGEAVFSAEPMCDMHEHGFCEPGSGHLAIAFKELSRMVCNSDTISVELPELVVTGVQVQHCFSVRTS